VESSHFVIAAADRDDAKTRSATVRLTIIVAYTFIIYALVIHHYIPSGVLSPAPLPPYYRTTQTHAHPHPKPPTTPPQQYCIADTTVVRIYFRSYTIHDNGVYISLWTHIILLYNITLWFKRARTYNIRHSVRETAEIPIPRPPRDRNNGGVPKRR